MTQTIDTETHAILCDNYTDRRIRLIAPDGQSETSTTLWCYPAEGEPDPKYKPTDSKRVERNGTVFVLISYHGRVRLVRFSDRKLVKDYATLGSCHSAELLPDGRIVSICSGKGELRLHLSDDEHVSYQLPYGHGVVWDKARKQLWALGDKLYTFSYANDKLKQTRAFELPLSPTGHDLFPLRKEAKLLVTNNKAVFLFDIKTETFETISERAWVKSASQHEDGSIWITEQKKLENAKPWHTDSVIRLGSKDPVVRHTPKGMRMYKARWWQKVTFSY